MHICMCLLACRRTTTGKMCVCVVRVVAIVLLVHSRGSSCLKGRGLFVLMLVPMFQ